MLEKSYLFVKIEPVTFYRTYTVIKNSSWPTRKRIDDIDDLLLEILGTAIDSELQSPSPLSPIVISDL